MLYKERFFIFVSGFHCEEIYEMFVKILQTVGCGLLVGIGFSAGLLIEWGTFVRDGAGYNIFMHTSRTASQEDYLGFVILSLCAIGTVAFFSFLAGSLFRDFVCREK